MIARTARRYYGTYMKRQGPLLARGIAFSLLLGSTPLLMLSAAAASIMYRFVPAIQTGTHVRLRDYFPPQVADPLIGHLEQVAAHWVSFGVVGVLLLALVAKSVFDSIGGGLHLISGGARSMSAVWRHAWSSVLTLLAVTLTVLVSLDDPVVGTIARVLPVLKGTFLYLAGSRLISVALLAGMLFVLYAVFEGLRGRLRRGMVVALAVSLLWHGLGAAGVAFVGMAARYNVLYGVFGATVLFMVWLQVFATLLLSGGMVIAGLPPQEPDCTPQESHRGLPAAPGSG